MLDKGKWLLRKLFGNYDKSAGKSTTEMKPSKETKSSTRWSECKLNAFEAEEMSINTLIHKPNDYGEVKMQSHEYLEHAKNMINTNSQKNVKYVIVTQNHSNLLDWCHVSAPCEDVTLNKSRYSRCAGS